MSYDVAAARRSVLGNARVLDRHRFAFLVDDGPREPVLTALSAYQNPDGGFGNALEPDLRDAASQPAATFSALEVLAEVGALDDPITQRAEAWLATIAHDDGSVPQVLASVESAPHAPWMGPEPEAGFFTLALVGLLSQGGAAPTPWRERAREWCWSVIGDGSDLEHFWVKFAFHFLDHDADDARAERTVAVLADKLGPDGSVPVPGGTEGERLGALVLSPRPGLRSRAAFTDDVVTSALDDLAAEQEPDGSWVPDFLAWSPAQAVEWRGRLTVDSVTTLRAHGRR
ncbi:hypothetical protein [Nocardioides sp.]|uniref:hypothetical protein n=1 Tax=Nocardioides sp. TaxID=35761 RepID=UPI00271BC727|nr:hypothetical protein [Nocardioides sp.]MDO9457585.1 hypothetical protein [Nocardioides sp.]